MSNRVRRTRQSLKIHPSRTSIGGEWHVELLDQIKPVSNREDVGTRFPDRQITIRPRSKSAYLICPSSPAPELAHINGTLEDRHNGMVISSSACCIRGPKP